MRALLSSQTSNVTGDAVRLHELVRKRSTTYSGGQWWTVAASGTFDGATVEIEWSPDNSTWFTDSDTQFTAEGKAVTVLATDAWIRAKVSSAGASTDVNLWVGQ